MICKHGIREIMKKYLLSLALLVTPLTPSPITAQDLSHRPHEEESGHYDASRDADADVNMMLTKIAKNGKMGIIILGANWCHDSRGLAKHFDSERFQAMLKPRYEIVYVDVGVPQIGNGRNLHIAKRFNLKKLKGTPTVAIINSSGKLLNKKDAPKWRNADSRDEDDIFNHFANFSANVRR